MLDCPLKDIFNIIGKKHFDAYYVSIVNEKFLNLLIWIKML